jgi:hypothetical protein
LGGTLATHGWLAFPAVNRLTMFDGRFLHGGLLVGAEVEASAGTS